MNKHKLDFCSHCGVYMYRCGNCDNNSCNGGYGEINGEICKFCPEAYELKHNLKLNFFQNLKEWFHHTKLYTEFYHLKHSMLYRKFYHLKIEKYFK